MKKLWLPIKWFFNSLFVLFFGGSFFNEKPQANLQPNIVGAVLFFVGFVGIAAIVLMMV